MAAPRREGVPLPVDKGNRSLTPSSVCLLFLSCGIKITYIVDIVLTNEKCVSFLYVSVERCNMYIIVHVV